MKAKEYPTQDELRKLFDYREDGQLIRKVSRGRVKAGTVAGSKDIRGYIKVMVNGTRYLAHRLIYIWHHGHIDPDMQIDHTNRVKDDNRISNLRVVTGHENQWNRSTALGYYWHNDHGKWKSQIKTYGKVISLGSYDTEQAARQAYLNAKERLHRIGENPTENELKLAVLDLKPNKKRRPVRIGNLFLPTVTMAAKVKRVSPSTIARHCNNPNFPDYTYVQEAA